MLTCAALAVLWVRTAERRRAFDLQALERHYVDAGHFAANRLPGDAVIFTVGIGGREIGRLLERVGLSGP